MKGHKTAVRIVFALLAIGFFTAPIAARVLGVDAEEFENRRLAVAPRLSQGWDAFQQTSRYLTDRMPLRAEAVRLNTRIWTNVFETDPTYSGQTALADDQALPFAGDIERDALAERRVGARAQAQTGKGGWGFVNSEFDAACDQSVPDSEGLGRWGKVVQAVRSEGHEAVMFVAPTKASIYPEHLPESYPGDDCSPEGKARFWRLLSEEGPALGVLGLRNELLRLKPQVGDGLFQRRDTHWSTLGAVALVEATLDAVGDGVRLERSEIVNRGSVSYTGDLSIIGGGQAEADNRIEYSIVRKPDAARVPGRTLLVCDSFAYRWLRLFEPYFDDVRYISIRRDEAEIAAAIRRSDKVIFAANEILVKVQWGRGELASAILGALGERKP